MPIAYAGASTSQSLPRSCPCRPSPPCRLPPVQTTLASPYVPPVSPTMHGFLAALLLLLGFAFTVGYATAPLSKKSRFFEMLFAALASAFLGSGTVFMFLWSGVWV